jgi:hypothetical protein
MTANNAGAIPARPVLANTVLAEVADLAAGNEWPPVSEFIRSLAPADDRTIAIVAAPEADPEPLAAWIHGLEEPTSIAAAGLESVAAAPATALAANRMVVVLRCGDLLMPETVDAAAAVAQRPAQTYRIVLTGAEHIRTPEDLDAVERGIWRVLLGNPGEEWRGQDIADRNCLLWSDGTADDRLTDRITRDVARLRDWVTGAADVPGELARDRALCAVWLATSAAESDALESTPARASGPGVDAARIADLAAEVRGLHSRLLSRMQADAGIAERQVAASLASLKQDLVYAMSPGRELPAGFVQQTIHQWEQETSRMLMQRRKATDEQAEELLDRVDWRLVNELAPHPAGDSYPKAILWHLMPQAANLSAETWRDVSRAAAGGAAPNWASALHWGSGGMLVGVGVGAAALVFLGAPLLPVAGVAAAGAIGGSLYERHRADEEHRDVRHAARKKIEAASENAMASASKALAEQADAVRAAVDREFTRLEEALDAAARGAASQSDPASADMAEAGPNERLAARLRELRDQFTA